MPRQSAIASGARPAGLPRSGPQSLTLLSVTHQLFFALVAAYLCVFHHQGALGVGVIYVAGVCAELLPEAARQFLVAELLLVASAVTACWLLVPRNDPEALYAAVGMGCAYACLVPSNFGRLRYLLSGAMFELVWQGQKTGSLLSMACVLPLGMSAIAIDAWMLSASMRNHFRSQARRPALRSLCLWAILPALLAAGIGVSAGLVLRHGSHPAHPVLPHSGEPPVQGLDNQVRMGDLTTISRDTRIAAKLSWSAGPDPQGMVYLRAMTLSQLAPVGSQVCWSRTDEQPFPAPPPSHAPTRWAWVMRGSGGGNIVLRPDGGDAVDLDDLKTDRDGNLFSPHLGDSQHQYRADFDDGELIADPADVERFTTVPAWLDALPWSQVEDRHWREVSPQRAAALICTFLAGHCHYSLDDLPMPAPGPGGALRTFLFGSESERRGHCQYFATSAVLLLRRAGHAARLVIGFASDEYDDDHQVTFRGLHAHAWLEVINSTGHWQRFDATPAEGLEQRGLNTPPPSASDPLADGHAPEQPPAVTTTSGTAPDGKGHLPTGLAPWSLLAAVPVLILLVWMRLRRGIDIRLQLLQRHSDSLLRLAVSMGMTVMPSTTLSQVAAGLQQRTGVDLSQHLEAHLRARFAAGGLPGPWPIAQLRAAAKRAPGPGNARA